MRLDVHAAATALKTFADELLAHMLEQEDLMIHFQTIPLTFRTDGNIFRAFSSEGRTPTSVCVLAYSQSFDRIASHDNLSPVLSGPDRLISKTFG